MIKIGDLVTASDVMKRAGLGLRHNPFFMCFGPTSRSRSPLLLGLIVGIELNGPHDNDYDCTVIDSATGTVGWTWSSELRIMK